LHPLEWQLASLPSSLSLSGFARWFIVSSWVRSSLRWLFSQVDVVASLGHVVKSAATANMVRYTWFGPPPRARHLSLIQPPINSPTKPLKKMMKVAPPSVAMLKPCTMNK
jgi:hypothetical protein